MGNPPVKRPAAPPSLATHAKDWTSELKSEYAKWTRSPKDTKKPQAHSDRYGGQDVRDALETMYHSRCCYCEGRITGTSVEHVEHYRPKGKEKYLDRSYEWENLHLACPPCNLAKGDDFDENCPPIIPTEHDPLDHFHYDLYHLLPKSESGDWTIEHCWLERPKLIEDRARYFTQLFDTLVSAETQLRTFHAAGALPRRGQSRGIMEKALLDIERALGWDAPFPSMVQENLRMRIEALKTGWQALGGSLP